MAGSTRGERTSVADNLFRALQAGIVDGTYPAGAMLPSERELARLNGVNRQPVREALQRLRQQGLVDVLAGEGARVRDWQSDAHLSVLMDAVFTSDGMPSPQLGIPLLRLRAVTMIEAARLAAQARTDEDLALLRSALGEVRRIEEFRHLTFWSLIVRASHSLGCQLIHNSMMRVAVRLPDEIRRAIAAETPLSEEAVQMVDAIEAGDGDGAARCAENLLAPVIRQLEGQW